MNSYVVFSPRDTAMTSIWSCLRRESSIYLHSLICKIIWKVVPLSLPLDLPLNLEYDLSIDNIPSKYSLTSNCALIRKPFIIFFLSSSSSEILQQNAGICMLSSCSRNVTRMDPRDNISSSGPGALAYRQCILQVNFAGSELCVLLGP